MLVRLVRCPTPSGEPTVLSPGGVEQENNLSARILPTHVKEGVIRGKSTSLYILVSGRPRSRELRDLVSFQLAKTGP